VRQQHRLVCLAVLALFGLAVLFGVSACGAGSGLESDSGQAKASERFAARRTVRIEMTAIPKAQTAVDTIVCEGAVDYENDRARMICDLGALGRTETITMGRANYERAEGGPFEDSTRADDKRWTKHTVNDDVDELTDIDPSRQLALLRSGARRTEEIGGDQIRGVPTLHYRLVVEASKVGLTRERQGMRELQSIDVWVDADDLLRRLRFEEDDPDENWHATTTIDFFDFGAPVEIDPPLPATCWTSTPRSLPASAERRARSAKRRSAKPCARAGSVFFGMNADAAVPKTSRSSSPTSSSTGHTRTSKSTTR
jgi:hypothetical protein